MEQFSLDEWLQDKSRKVVTRDGREVEIVKYDMKGTHFPILYVISNEDGSQEPCECSKSGMCQFDNTQSSTDLFFADEEEELTEFEKELQIIISDASHWTSDDGSISTCCYFGDKEIKKISGQILDLARKELELIDNTCSEAVLNASYQQGKQDALKDLPKWYKSGDNLPYPYIGGLDKEYLVKNGYYIKLSDLETLPKEE